MSKTLSINVLNKAATQLIGVGFNSSTVFNGRTYFAGPSGLTREDGVRDDELDVKAWVTIHPLDIGTVDVRAVRTLVVYGRIGGQLRISIEGGGKTISYLSNSESGSCGVKIGLDKCLKDWSQKIRIENYDGASINLSKAYLTIVPGVSRRL